MNLSDSLYQERYDELANFLLTTEQYDPEEVPNETAEALEEMMHFEQNPMMRCFVEQSKPAWAFVTKHLVTPEMRIVTGQYAQPAIDLAISLAWVAYGKTPLIAFLQERKLSPANFVIDVWTGIQQVRGELLVEEES